MVGAKGVGPVRAGTGRGVKDVAVKNLAEEKVKKGGYAYSL